MGDLHDLYKKFSSYCLSEEQLRRNDFPEQCPDNPLQIIIRDAKFGRQTAERHCVRCNNVFYLRPNHSYKAEGALYRCSYHPKPNSYEGHLCCCCNDIFSDGCTLSRYHVTSESSLQNVVFLKTKKKVRQGDKCNVYALDCEMVYTTDGLELAKVAVIDVHGQVVFNQFVHPLHQILDYNTTYSGIREQDLIDVHLSVFNIRQMLLEFLSDGDILVGHGLENDLRALRLIHRKVVDTSVVFPQKQEGFKKSLKNLAQEYLNKKIQSSPSGHNCIEDAQTCLELMMYKIRQDFGEKPMTVANENARSLLSNSPSVRVPVTPKNSHCPKHRNPKNSHCPKHRNPLIGELANEIRERPYSCRYDPFYDVHIWSF